MAVTVGTVYVDVKPSTKGFVTDMEAQLLAQLDALGASIGDRIGKQLGDNISTQVSKGVTDGLGKADTKKEGEKAGKLAGDAFGRSLQDEIKHALSALPTVKFKADNSEIDNLIAQIRSDLGAVFDEDAKLVLDGRSALNQIANVRSALEDLRRRDNTVDIDFDIDTAMAALGQLEERIATGGTRAGDAFGRELRAEITSALDALPEPELHLESSALDMDLARLRGEMSAIFNQRGELNLTGARALAEVARIRTELEALRGQKIELDFDIDRALGSLGNLHDKITAQGRADGGAFGRDFRAALDAALRDLPAYDVKIDTSDAAARVALLRYEIDGLRDMEFGLDINPDIALAELARIRAELHAIADDSSNPDILRLNATSALRGIDALSERFERLHTQVERQAGSWATTVRTALEGALRSLPDFELDANTTPAMARVAALRAQIAQKIDLDIGANLSGDETFAQIDLLISKLEILRDQPDVDVGVKADAVAAIASLQAVIDKATQADAQGVDIPVDVDTGNAERELGAFATKVRAAVASAIKALPDLELKANSSDVARKITEIRGELVALNDLKIGVDIDAPAFESRLAALKARLVALSDTKVHIQADADVAGAIAAIESLDAATEKAGSSGSRNLNTLRTVLLATTLGFAPASAAAIGLSAGLLAAAAPIGAVVAGMNGIKEAGGQLTPQLAQIRQAVSATFQQGLQPAVANVAAVLPTLSSGLVGTAGALSTMAGKMTSVVAESRNLSRLDDAFEQVNVAIVKLGPPLATMLQNMIGFADIGARALTKLGPMLDQVGEAWTRALETFERTGSAEAAIEQLFQILSDLLALAAPIAQLGVAVMAALGPALSGALELLAGLIQRVADGFDSLPGPLQAALAAMVLFKATMLIMGKSTSDLTAGVQRFGSAVDSEFTKIGQAFTNGATRSTAATRTIDSAVSAVTNRLGTLGGASSKAGQELADGITKGAAGLSKLPAAVDTAASQTKGKLDGLLRDGVSTLGQMGTEGGRNFGTKLADGLTNGIDKAFNALEHPLNAINTGIGRTLTGIGDSFQALPRAVGSATQATGTLLSGFARGVTGTLTGVAQTVKSLVTGPNGLLAALGGGWGLAIAAAVTALSLFGAAQQEAEQKAASFRQSVHDTAAALQETGGAITTAMEKAETLTLVQAGLASSATGVGVNLAAAAQAAIRGGEGYEQLRTKLEGMAAAGENANFIIGQSPGYIDPATQAMADQGVQAQALLDALGPLAQKYKDAATENQIFRDLIAQSGNSMLNGIGAAAQLGAAFATLSDEMKTTSDRASALQAAMLLLTGGTLPAEQAVAQMRQSLADVGKNFEEAEKAAKKAGVGILDASGNINQATEEGRKLVLSLSSISSGALQAATSTFDAEKGIKGVAVASTDAGNVVREARAAFLKMADGAGIGAAAANRYADQMGLIPELVVTLLKAEGVDGATQQVLQLAETIRRIPPGKTINIGAVAPEAFAVLQSVGIQVKTLPDGTVEVTATDKTPAQVAAIVAAIGKTPGAEVPVTTNNAGVATGAAAAAATVSATPGAAVPVTTNNAGVAPGAAAAAATVTGTPAPLPVNADGSTVPADAAAIRQGVQSIPAQIDIVGTDKTSSVIADIRTQAGLPMDMYIYAVDLTTEVIAGIRNQALFPVEIPINAVDNTTAVLDGIRSSAATPVSIPIDADVSAATQAIDAVTSQASGTTATMKIDADSGPAAGVLSSMAGSITGTTAVMKIDADPGPASGVLASLSGTITGTTATMKIDANSALAELRLVGLKARIDTTTATMKIDANTAFADLRLAGLMGRIGTSTGTVKVDANTAAAEAAISTLTRPRSMTVTVNVQQNGTVPGARGMIMPAGGSMIPFANGGQWFNGHKLTKMAAGRAQMVPPRTFRVIGDRSRDDELYLPINGSPRSKMLLGVAANRMGYGLTPMAAGGILRGREDAFAALAASLERSPTTQSSRSFTPPLASTGSGPGSVLAPGVENKLGEISELLRARQPTQITVQDRSGNPVETARSTALALRLAR